jgi:MFS family permease
MVGMERSILPALAEQEFHLVAKSAVLAFIVVFGVSKALTNYLAGRLSDRYGRKIILVAGWLVAIPAPLLLIWAPSWTWVLVANVFLGVSQGLTWSTTVIMKIDLAGPKQRGLAMGINEFAGYLAVGLSALATGWIATHYGLRPDPFYLGIVFVILGLFLSIGLIKETLHHARHEAKAATSTDTPPQSAIFWQTTLEDRNLSSITQAGLVNNLNDGMAWGLFPILFAASGLTFAQIGLLAALYPSVWGVGQLFTGGLSDRIGRKGLIVAGMWVQAVGISAILIWPTFWSFALSAVLLGAGTAMVYPTLLAAIGDVVNPAWRASTVGVYRFWRDMGYAIGALLSGIVADLFGITAAIGLVALITFLSGALAAIRMAETHKTQTST